MKSFNDGQIKRTDIPADVFSLIHDLCYHVNNRLRGHMDERAIENYSSRAQGLLKSPNKKSVIVSDHSELTIDLCALLKAIEEMKPCITNDKHIPWNNVLHFAEKIKSGNKSFLQVFTAVCPRCGKPWASTSAEQAETNALQCDHL